MPLRLSVTSDNRTRFGEHQSKEFVACGGTLGRSLDNDWVFPDPNRFVSGRHALIDFQASAYYLVDTSHNGVYINDEDAPVGRGHPQRLFDGDVIRIGDYIIEVTVTEETMDIGEDGMRDSVVRAQLVEEDDSIEMQMVDEDRLVGGESLDLYLQEGEGSSRISQLNKLPFDIPSDAYQGLNIAKHAEQKALELLLEGAGLKAGDLPGCEPAEVLKLSGQILRHMVAGLISLMKERKELKNALRLSHTNIQSDRQNPLKLAPSLDDALKYLLGNASKSCLPAQEAVQASFLEVKNHEKAVPKALVHALKEFMEHFAPDELRQQVDRGVKHSRLLGAPNKLKYWDLFEQSYTDLTHGPDDTLPEAFSQEFSRAYAHAVESLKSARTK